MSKHSMVQQCEARTSALVSMDRGMNHQLRLSVVDWRPEKFEESAMEESISNGDVCCLIMDCGTRERLIYPSLEQLDLCGRVLPS